MKREEFIALVKSEQEGLRRFLLALCLGNHDEADDIAQEALIKAYLSCSCYQNEGKLVSWLYTIAHRTFIDYKRTNKTFQSIDNVVPTVDDTFVADGAFKYQDLYVALKTLSPKERTAILLFYMRGYSVKEISAVVECTEDAVKKQLSRGREQLRKMIKR